MAAGFWTVQGLGWAQDCRNPTPAISTTPNESREGGWKRETNRAKKRKRKAGWEKSDEGGCWNKGCRRPLSESHDDDDDEDDDQRKQHGPADQSISRISFGTTGTGLFPRIFAWYVNRQTPKIDKYTELCPRPRSPRPAGQGSNDRNRNIPGFETGLTPTVCAQALEVLHPLPLRFTFFVLVQNSKITVIFQDDAVALVPTIATLVCHATKSALVQ
ncbi:hypothetical protein CIRG_09523 [Coccidioides immitis RMSCC 2394]|uniref:Uncharacterized protein n=1 Tax=Coccidioides immitis RMSCC 2394 TaxID=404692 RepID=A0A0J6YQW4_COCIT|nr:hypothetical protein CIRG_09523 [Coccidioides immitis RMSCC 2394]